MDDHVMRMLAFENEHIIETIQRMAGDLRKAADTLDRIAGRPGSTPGWRAQEAWGEIRNTNSNLRVDILISSLTRMAELHAADDPAEFAD